MVRCLTELRGRDAKGGRKQTIYLEKLHAEGSKRVVENRETDHRRQRSDPSKAALPWLFPPPEGLLPLN